MPSLTFFHPVKLKLASILTLVCSSAFASEAPKPNILVVLTDDIGWADPQCYNPQGKIPTPSIDKLAAEGMRFTHAHTPAALCAPTRYSMLTGNFPWRGRAARGTWGHNVPSQIMPGQKTIAQLLRTAGYRTAMFGKAGIGGFWGMIPGQKPKRTLAPIAWGFDYSFLIPRGHQSTPFAFFENGITISDLKNNKAPDWDASKVGSALLEKATAFLDEHQSKHKDAPFYMHFCTDGAHSPFVPAKTLNGQILKGSTKMTDHTDMIHETDILLGALVDALEKRGLRDNTLVIYTSDNGGLPYERALGHDSVAGLRGNKSTIFEGGQRVPFVASWPGKIPSGTVRNQLVGAHDTVATSLELAGVQAPSGQVIDSVSLVPVLLGEQDDAKPVRSVLFTQSSPGRGVDEDNGYRANKPAAKTAKAEKGKGKNKKAIAFAVYEDHWKLVVSALGEPAALFDLSNDLAEENNLINRHPERVTSMAKQYRELRK
ncbi:sulfatase family protein [Haloferula sp.]|uniref:sulfatase family protein n=1 Tax=Haloferula sp. TaxID=2497595 RepID=UPI00329ACD22